MKSLLQSLLYSLLILVGITACGGGGGGDAGTDPTVTPPLTDRAAYGVNVLTDKNGDSVIAVNSRVGEGAYLVFNGTTFRKDTLEGVIYQSPDGRTARLTLNADGSPAELQTDEATYVYSGYTGSQITVTVKYPDGTEAVFPNLPVDPSLYGPAAKHAAKAIDQQDVAFAIGFVGTSMSIAFCVLPAATGVGTLVTVGCANALLGTVGTVLGSTEIGTGSTVIDLIAGYATGDMSSVATGLLGAVSTVMGWESEPTLLKVALSGRAVDATSAGALTVAGAPAEARVFIRDKTGGAETEIKLSPNGTFSLPKAFTNGSYAIRIEAKGYLNALYTLAISGSRVMVSEDSDIPDVAAKKIYETTQANLSVPAVVYLSVEMTKAPRITGRILWPRDDEIFGERVEIVEGGLIGLYDAQGKKAAFHTAGLVSQGGLTPTGEPGAAGGTYELWLPSRHGAFSIDFSNAHSDKQTGIVSVSVNRGQTIVIDTPKTGFLNESTVTHSFVPGGDIPSTDIPVKSRYDGNWFIRATPSIPSYTYSYEITNDQGEPEIRQATAQCSGFTVSLAIENGGGTGTRDDGEESAALIEFDGLFQGSVWGLSWDGYIYKGGKYTEDGLGDKEIGCYGTFTSESR